jgi:hypothetical protein
MMGTKVHNNYEDLITFTRASDGTYLDSDGLLKTASSNEPRVEYDAAGNRLGLLVEEARTNIVAYSEDFSQSSWVKHGAGVASAAIVTGGFVSPTGTNTATRLQCDLNGGASSGDQSLIYDALAGTGNHSMSFWVKSNTGSNQTFAFGNSLAAFTTGVATNEWQRFTYSANLLANRNIFIGARGTIGADDTLDILIFGAQQESGAFPTSYIKNEGTPSGATRSADVASIPVADFGYNQSEGTMFVEIDSLTDTLAGNPMAYQLNDGTTSERLTVFGSGASWRFVATDGGAQQSSILGGTFGTAKIASSFEQNKFNHCVNGTLSTEDTSGTMPTITELGLGNQNGGNLLNGHIKSIKYYPRRLTNAQLQDLTS